MENKNEINGSAVMFVSGDLTTLVVAWIVCRFGDMRIKFRHACLMVWWFLCFLFGLGLFSQLEATSDWCYENGTACGYAALVCFVATMILAIISKFSGKWHTILCSYATGALASIWFAGIVAGSTY